MNDHASTQTASEHASCAGALSRGAVYELLSVALGPPTGATTSMLAREDLGAALAEILGALGVESAVPPACRLDAHDLDEALYARLFGHTARGNVPPFETEYGQDSAFRQPADMADIAGFYAAFGLAVDPTKHERPDHVRSECEFMAFLAGKEAFANENGDLEMLAAVERAEKLFLEDHLGRFASAFGARLVRENPNGFYGAIGQIMGEFIRWDAGRSGARLGPDSLPLRPVEDDGAPMACGVGSGCGAPGTPSLGSCPP